MKHTTMMNYDRGDDDGDDNQNNNDNAASGSGFNSPIFNPITTPMSISGGLGDDGGGNTAAVRYISTLLKMCYKLMYATFGVLDWCHCHTKKLPQFN